MPIYKRSGGIEDFRAVNKGIDKIGVQGIGGGGGGIEARGEI